MHIEIVGVRGSKQEPTEAKLTLVTSSSLSFGFGHL